MRHIDLEIWEEEYEPIMNEDGENYKDFHPKMVAGQDYTDLKQAITENRVWTLLDTDSGMVITNGLHWVNRMDVYITKQPFNKEEIIEIKY